MPSKATQKNRSLAIETALGADALVLRSVALQEQLGRPFNFEIELSSEDGEVKFDDLIGTNATIRLELPEKATRYFNGIVSRLSQGANKGGLAHYRATLVPWLWLLTRTADCRIFQNKSVPDIIEAVFKGHDLNDYELKLSETHGSREYCVQYRETDFNFVSRLMEQEGIYYYFKHEDGKHIMVLADAISAHAPFTGYEEVTYSELEKGADGEEAITDWQIEKQVQPGAYVLNDFDFIKPKASLLAVANVTRNHAGAAFEIFDYPGDYVKHSDGEYLAKVRLDEYQSKHEVCRGQSSAKGLSAGCTFTLKKHAREDQNREYLITAVSLQAEAGEYASGGKDESDYFGCGFEAIDKVQPFRAPQTTPKPIVQGPQTAMVVGPKGEEIHVDEHGRVKVSFPWDRYSKVDENSSCWIRVSQSWAGKKWGSIYTPRIGQEVIVEFLEGDPDRPIITGRVYNGEAKPPYALPAEKTKSTLKSNSSIGGEGFNEIRFEDKKDGEQVFIHAQKDMDVRVNNDFKEIIGGGPDGSKKEGNRHLIVKKDRFELVEGDTHATIKGNQLSKIEGDHGETTKGDHHVVIEGADHLTVKGDQCVKISGDASFKTDKNLNQESGAKISFKAAQDVHGKAGTTYAMEAGTSVHIKGGTTVVIEASTQLSLKVGGNFIDIGPAGVSIKGTMVMINSGGAAGSGGGSSPTAPVAPEPPDPPKDAKEADNAKAGLVDEPPPAPTPPEPVKYSSAAKVLSQAAQDGTPFCEECARAAAEAAEEGDELITITSIAWLDGADDKELAAPTQWVNLPRDAKFVDVPNGVANIDRLGQKVRFKVSFSKPGSHAFKVKVEPGDDNVVYTDPEKGRNANFKFQDQEKSYTTGGDGTKIVEADFFTASAGGDKFKLIGTDSNNSPAVETGELTTKRLIYYVLLKMKNLAAMATDLSGFRSEFGARGIEMLELPAVEMDRIENISDDDSDAYETKCKTAFNGSTGKNKLPYAVAIGFTDHLAVKKPNVDLELPGVTVGPDKTTVEVPVMATGLRDGDGLAARSLWQSLVTGESWFVSATFTPDGKSAINLPVTDCQPVPINNSSPFNCRKIKVDVSKLAAGVGTLKLRVNVVDRMRGGISFSGNRICVCARSWWKDRDAASQIQTMIHEMGHKVGMVCDGTGKLPDKPATYYKGKGHVGSHCHFDLPVQDSYSNATNPKCIMFGSNATGRPSNFCENCAPAVRKMDLSTGWIAS